jgi:hypothetical protein
MKIAGWQALFLGLVWPWPPSTAFGELGTDWVLATANAYWSPRYDHGVAVFHSRMWVLGGAGRLSYRPSISYSPDGSTWTVVSDIAPWAPRSGHTSVVYGGKIWLIGGGYGSRFGWNDVWYSSDGVHWTSGTAHAAWHGRRAHTSVAYGGKMWVLGGQYYDPVAGGGGANSTTSGTHRMA